MIKTETFSIDQNKVKDFYSNSSNFINCIPNVKDINGNQFKLNAIVGAMQFTVDAELTQQTNNNQYLTFIKINGPGVTINITSKLTIQDNQGSIDADYTAEGPAVSMVGGLLDSTINTMMNQTSECIKKKISSKS
ncbi:SRPBCC domain-containing protein [Acidianus manzaensis]|uniref:Carbon monoxide dehydrogenase n=1 Tax=Acidianus manzaensis TaxID=282676 RepID=A0A1W6JZ35_9CREN|nr:SRPBCC domain-containing protein [Acidianus manzaensis]ARM75526.1 hypothetical protein B6F84_05425 [Acidianus manzaensis]